jgi:HEAT repeat protein
LPAPAVEVPKPPPAPVFKRINNASEEHLTRELAALPEVGLGAGGPAVLQAYEVSQRVAGRMVEGANPATVAPLLKLRPDLAVLPLRDGVTSRLTPRAALDLQLLSRKLHVYLKGVAILEPANRDAAIALLRQALERDRRGRRPEWLRDEAVPTLTQMLQGEDARGRRLLVDLLARIPGRRANVALARRAVFDPNAGVREAAVQVLKNRPSDDWRPVLLAGLRHPWPPAGDHAAEALVELRDRAAVPSLLDQLGQPDPGAPSRRGEHLMTRELVRINHLTNCLLCHAPSLNRRDLVRKEVPGQTRIAVKQSCQPGGSGGGYGRGGGSGTSTRAVIEPAYVRADITFLRQDFSAPLPLVPVVGAGKGLPPVRFDFVVRTRALTLQESLQLRKQSRDKPQGPTACSQRKAALFALRELTGQDHGDGTLAWKRQFPQAGLDVQAGKLIDVLSAARGLERDRLLGQYQGSVGEIHTRALGWAAYRFQGPAREQARTALANRVGRMTPAELRGALRHDLPEVREAAIQACLRKKDQRLVADLIPLVQDPEPALARLARAVLKDLTGRSFERASQWKLWWHQSDGAVASR